MATRQQIQQAFLDHVLSNGEQPKSVYIFGKKNKIPETEFYEHFGSFEGVEESIWTDLIAQTITEIQQQEIWAGYSAREKMLSFFYSYTELLKQKRSFVVYSMSKLPVSLSTPAVFEGTKLRFMDFAVAIIGEGLESSELATRRFFSGKYKDALWAQFIFILRFWVKDSSAGFEKTDEAIEKGINVTFDLFQRSPIDNLLEYGKFLMQNA